MSCQHENILKIFLMQILATKYFSVKFYNKGLSQPCSEGASGGAGGAEQYLRDVSYGDRSGQSPVPYGRGGLGMGQRRPRKRQSQGPRDAESHRILGAA